LVTSLRYQTRNCLCQVQSLINKKINLPLLSSERSSSFSLCRENLPPLWGFLPLVVWLFGKEGRFFYFSTSSLIFFSLASWCSCGFPISLLPFHIVFSPPSAVHYFAAKGRLPPSRSSCNPFSTWLEKKEKKKKRKRILLHFFNVGQ
jgi:hypothetical protein